jgi:hypothetical protein
MINPLTDDGCGNMKNGMRKNGENSSAPIRHLRSEQGVVLVVVIVLSAVALAIMTTLIYMITTGTQISGLQKRYKTALEAGVGGGEVFYQLIATRAETAGLASFESTFDSFGLNFSATTPAGCTGISSGATYTSLAAKFMTPSSSWSGCSDSITIDTADSTSYDMKVELGITTKYNVYAKIIAATDGNSGGDESLLNKGVVTANTGEVSVSPIPFLYTIEVVAENSDNTDERAKLSVLYQY